MALRGVVILRRGAMTQERIIFSKLIIMPVSAIDSECLLNHVAAQKYVAESSMHLARRNAQAACRRPRYIIAGLSFRFLAPGSIQEALRSD